MSDAVPKKYVQVWSNYDKSCVDKCHSLIFYTQNRDKNDVHYQMPCVFATPDRAFAQMKDQIARKKKISVDQLANITIPLPIISLGRVDQKLDLSRYVRHKFNRLYYGAAEDKYTGMIRPQPWDITYQVDVWARNIGDLDDLTSQIVLWLRADEFYLTVGHPLPMGERLVLTQFAGMAENSKMDTAEEKRTLRRTFSFVVHGWIVHEPYEASIVRKVVASIYDNTIELDPVFLDQVVVTSADVPSDDIPSSLPEDTTMGKVTTSLYGVMIVGEAEDEKFYGNFAVPANSTITGMQVSVLGRSPEGDDLRLLLAVNGIADSDRYITLPEGDVKRSITFGTPVDVVTGDVLSVYCNKIGSIEPGSWIEVRYNARINVVV